MYVEDRVNLDIKYNNKCINCGRDYINNACVTCYDEDDEKYSDYSDYSDEDDWMPELDDDNEGNRNRHFWGAGNIDGAGDWADVAINAENDFDDFYNIKNYKADQVYKRIYKQFVYDPYYAKKDYEFEKLNNKIEKKNYFEDYRDDDYYNVKPAYNKISGLLGAHHYNHYEMLYCFDTNGLLDMVFPDMKFCSESFYNEYRQFMDFVKKLPTVNELRKSKFASPHMKKLAVKSVRHRFDSSKFQPYRYLQSVC